MRIKALSVTRWGRTQSSPRPDLREFIFRDFNRVMRKYQSSDFTSVLALFFMTEEIPLLQEAMVVYISLDPIICLFAAIKLK